MSPTRLSGLVVKAPGGCLQGKVNLAQKISLFDERWSPKIVGSYNGNDLMIAKVLGEFPWHSHPDTDDFFFVLKGELQIRLRTETISLHAGELYVVPAGVEHAPFAEEEAHLLVIETSGTPNTGDPTTAVIKEFI